MPAQTRSRPQPAGEPAPTTIDPPATPVEDVPAVATPPAEPAPEPAPELPVDETEWARENGVVPVFGRLPEVGEAAYGPDSEPLRDPYPLTAAEALAEVMRRVRPIAKGRQADARVGGYAFRGIDDVYAALHDLFAEVGLVCLPSTIEREREQRPRMSGEGSNYVTHVRVRLRFLSQDGSSEELDAWGEGADTGDKSTGKAYSQAMKSALLAAFLIPTQASSQDDPDATNSEPSRSWTVAEQERAETALTAAQDATTLDALVGVGRRAHAGGLLDVPVVLDRTLAPLRLHLDGIREQLERQVRS